MSLEFMLVAICYFNFFLILLILIIYKSKQKWNLILIKVKNGNYLNKLWIHPLVVKENNI